MTISSQWRPNLAGFQQPDGSVAFGRPANQASHWVGRGGGEPVQLPDSNNAVNPLLNLPSRVVPENNPAGANLVDEHENSTNNSKTRVGQATQAVERMMSESEYLEKRQKQMEEWFAENLGMPPADKLLIGAAAGLAPTMLLKWAFGLHPKEYFQGLQEARLNAPIYRFAYSIDRWPIIRHISDALSQLGTNLAEHNVEGHSDSSTRFHKFWAWQKWLTQPIDRALNFADAEINNLFHENDSVTVLKNHVDEGMRSIEHLAPHRRYVDHDKIKELNNKNRWLFSQKAEHFIKQIEQRSVGAKPNLLKHEVLSERYGNWLDRYSKLSITKDGEGQIIRQFYTKDELRGLKLDPDNVTIKQLKQTLKPGLFKRLSGKAIVLEPTQSANLREIIKLAKREKKYLRHLLGVQTRLEGFTNMHLYNYHLEKGMMDIMQGRVKGTKMHGKTIGTIGRFIVSISNAAREVLDGSFVMGHTGNLKGGAKFMARLMPIMVPAMAIGMPLYEAGKAKFGDKIATFMHHLLGYEFGFFIGWQVGRNLLNEINFGTRLTQAVDQIPTLFEKGLNKVARVFGDKNSQRYVGKISHWLFKSRQTFVFGRVSLAGFLMFMMFSQYFANRLKGRFEKISHAIFGYPESVRAEEAKQKAEELADKMNSMSPAFRNHTQEHSFSSRQPAAAKDSSASSSGPSLFFQSRARQLLHHQSDKKKEHSLSSFPMRSASAPNTITTNIPQGAGTLSHIRSNSTPIHHRVPVAHSAPSAGRLNPMRFFNQPAVHQPSSTTQPMVAQQGPTDPFAEFDPRSIQTMPSNLPAQLAAEQQQLADILSGRVAG